MSLYASCRCGIPQGSESQFAHRSDCPHFGLGQGLMSTAAKFSGPVCRGSWSLGTACGKCERCKATCPTDTQAPDVVVMEADIVATADLFEAMHDKAAAWAVRSVGLCGTVHHATAEFLARHRLSTQSAMQARIEKLEAAVNDNQATLLAIKADCAARIEWEEDQMASHIVDICQQTMLSNRAALSSAIGQPEAEFSGWVEVVEDGE